MNISKYLILGTLAVLLVLVASRPAIGETEYDLRTTGNLTLNGAYFEEFSLEGSTGTGVFNPFLQVNKSGLGGGSHPQSPVYGYNTDLSVPDFPVTFYITEPTYAVPLSELPRIQFNSVWYREFVLDSNQDKGGGGQNRLLTWDELRIYQTNTNMINYTTLSGLTPIWDLDSGQDRDILFDGQYAAGSGQGDMRILIPDSLFSLSYEYVIAWVSFGGYNTDPGNNATAVVSTHPNNDGFEEFGYIVYPPVPDISITKTADIDKFCLNEAPFPVTYTYLVENTGNDDLDGVVVTDDTCSSPSYISGDDGDGLLNPGEIWTYQCTTVLNDATTNTGTVVATGVISGIEVTDSDTAFVYVVEVAVSIDPATAEICEGDEPVQLCAVASLGSGDYSYLWSTGETTECIDVDTGDTYTVTVTDNNTGCEDTAEATLTVVTPPVCSIDGKIEVCDTDSEIEYCSINSADSYSWSIDEGGDAEIVGATDGKCVYVNPTGPGSFTLRLRVCNKGEVVECCDECTLDVTVYPCTPGIQIVKYPNIDKFCLSEAPVDVTYTYEVSKSVPGTEDIVDVYVEDDTCSEPTYVSGDDGDEVLEDGETWIYTCSTSISETTENFVFAEGYGIFSDVYTYDDDTATVTAYDLQVEVTPAESEICEGGDPVHLCVNIVTPGSGHYSYIWSTGETTDCIDVDTAGTYTVTVTDNDYGCQDTAEASLTVIDIPDCSIEGPPSLCVGDQVQFCASVSNADSYVWVIALGSEYAEIVGDDTGNCVTVHATGEGTFRLALDICNAGDVISCCNECSIDVPIEPCGGAFCTFTQGFYGNKGGKACGLKTANLIDTLLGYGDVVVGVPGAPGHSITLGSSDCIIALLPASGTATVLPEGDFVCDGSTNNIPASLLTEFSKKDSRFNNVLIGQIVALTLNLRLYSIDCMGGGGTGDLAGWTLPEEFCTMGKDGCAKKHTTPDAFVGMEVGAILALANDVIAGEDVGVSPSEINDVVDFINETFDGCKEIVTCPTVEICNNGCDDDFDGLVDCADPDCYGVGNCPTP
jgi:hypothetical protein